MSAVWKKLASGALPARTNHSCVVYAQHTAIVFGGEDETERLSNDTFSFQYLNGGGGGAGERKWTKVATTGSTPSPRSGHAACVAGECMYVFGGRTGAGDGHPLNDMYQLNLTTNKWTQIQYTAASADAAAASGGDAKAKAAAASATAPPAARFKHSMVYVPRDEAVWLQPLAASKSDAKASDGKSPAVAAEAGAGGCLLVFGGWDGDRNSYKNLHIFDIARCVWSTVVVPNSVERIWHAGVWHAPTRSLYIYAGEDKNIFLQNDMFTIQWKPAAAAAAAKPAAVVDSAANPDCGGDDELLAAIKASSAASGAAATASASDAKQQSQTAPPATTAAAPASAQAGSWVWSRVAYADGAEAPFPPDRYAHSACIRTSDDSMIVFGGYGGEMTLFSDSYQYSFAHKRWRQLSRGGGDAPIGRHAHTGVCMGDGAVLIVGGKAASMANLNHCYELTIAESGASAKWATEPVKAAPMWQCPNCTMMNNGWAPVCSVDQTPKPQPRGGAASSASVKPAVAAGPWTCSVCTYTNNAARRECEMCGTPNL